jgi:hypothetical protein
LDSTSPLRRQPIPHIIRGRVRVPSRSPFGDAAVVVHDGVGETKLEHPVVIRDRPIIVFDRAIGLELALIVDDAGAAIEGDGVIGTVPRPVKSVG